MPWLGTKPEDVGLTVRPGSDHHGELQAWDPGSGKKGWQHNFPWQLFAIVLGTGDDLVFAADRMLGAFDAPCRRLAGTVAFDPTELFRLG